MGNREREGGASLRTDPPWADERTGSIDLGRLSAPGALPRSTRRTALPRHGDDRALAYAAAGVVYALAAVGGSVLPVVLLAAGLLHSAPGLLIAVLDVGLLAAGLAAFRRSRLGLVAGAALLLLLVAVSLWWLHAIAFYGAAQGRGLGV